MSERLEVSEDGVTIIIDDYEIPNDPLMQRIVKGLLSEICMCLAISNRVPDKWLGYAQAQEQISQYVLKD